jgi:hypothetical protein
MCKPKENNPYLLGLNDQVDEKGFLENMKSGFENKVRNLFSQEREVPTEVILPDDEGTIIPIIDEMKARMSEEEPYDIDIYNWEKRTEAMIILIKETPASNALYVRNMKFLLVKRLRDLKLDEMADRILAAKPNYEKMEQTVKKQEELKIQISKEFDDQH